MSSWFLPLPTLFLALLLFNLNVSESKLETKTKPPSAIVVGTVYCDTCFQDVFSRPTHSISGALVAVECGGSKDKTEPFFRQEVETDEHGEFKVQLPLSISKHLKRIKGCSVNLVRSSDPYCAVASTATSSSIRLKGRKNQDTHIFSAGFFTFKPLKQPTLCSQKPTDDQFPSKIDTSFPPPLQDPPVPFLSPLLDPILPPVLGNLPQLPLLPPIEETSSKVKAQVPMELQGGNTLPDLMINPSPPIPLLPSPPSLFPSNPFQPSTPPLLNIPPLIPGLIPSSSSPPTPPVFSFPTFPFQPSPVFPGTPQATKKTSSP